MLVGGRRTEGNVNEMNDSPPLSFDLKSEIENKDTDRRVLSQIMALSAVGEWQRICTPFAIEFVLTQRPQLSILFRVLLRCQRAITDFNETIAWWCSNLRIIVRRVIRTDGNPIKIEQQSNSLL